MIATTPAVERAWHNLAGVLNDLADEGRYTACQLYPDAWSADARVSDRRQAAEACRHCPALAACATYADAAGERWHVWGGMDRANPPRRKENS